MIRPNLVLFPGMGGDARIYEPQRRSPLDFEVAEWIAPESPGESLAHYALRMASTIGPRADLIIGGISFGAMVAFEVAASLEVAGVIAIGSCTSYQQISPLFRAALSAGAAMPSKWVRRALKLTPVALNLFERLEPDDVEMMTRMLRDQPQSLLQWSCRAVRGWECPTIRVPSFSIHGEQDQVIPLKNVRPGRIVKGGRHLINLGCPREVAEFIQDCIRNI